MQFVFLAGLVVAAPPGNKGCHYEMQRVLVDARGNYIATVNWFDTRTKGNADNASAKPETMVCRFPSYGR